MHSETTPRVGQAVDFYPDNKSRNAALVVEVLEDETEGDRPAVHLQVFGPDGTIDYKENVLPVEDIEGQGIDSVDLADRWGFHHEFPLQNAGESQLGTLTNDFVGQEQ